MNSGEPSSPNTSTDNAFELHCERAGLLIDQKRFDLALEELARVLAIDPNQSFVHNLIAFALTGLGRLDEAQAAAESAIRIDPENDSGFRMLGIVLMTKGKVKKAEEALKKSIEMYPDHALTWSMLAQCAGLEKNWKRVVELASHGLEIDANEGNCLYFLCLGKLMLGDQDEARRIAHHLLAQYPNVSNTHILHGIVSMRNLDIEDSSEFFKQSLHLDPNNSVGRFHTLYAQKFKNRLHMLILMTRYMLLKLFRNMLCTVAIFLAAAYWLVFVVGTTNHFINHFQAWVGIAGLTLIALLQMENPFFLTLNRLHRNNRHLLDLPQIMQSNIFLWVFGSGALATGVALAYKFWAVAWLLAGFTVALSVSSVVIPMHRRPDYKPVLKMLAIISFVAGGAAVAATLLMDNISIFTWFYTLCILLGTSMVAKLSLKN